jgi:hypothetical protein
MELALATTVPAILTGSRFCNRSKLPCSSNLNSTSNNVVKTSSGGNLNAIAHLGFLRYIQVHFALQGH